MISSQDGTEDRRPRAALRPGRATCSSAPESSTAGDAAIAVGDADFTLFAEQDFAVRHPVLELAVFDMPAAQIFAIVERLKTVRSVGSQG